MTDMNLRRWAAYQAAEFAQAIGLPVANMWEPAIARSLVREIEAGRFDRDTAVMMLRLNLGIAKDRSHAV